MAGIRPDNPRKPWASYYRRAFPPSVSSRSRNSLVLGRPAEPVFLGETDERELSQRAEPSSSLGNAASGRREAGLGFYSAFRPSHSAEIRSPADPCDRSGS